MSPEQIQRFKERLEIEQRTLLADKEGASDAAKPVELDQTSVGRLSRMDAMQGQAMTLELQRRRDAQLQRIEAALARIQGDDYGLCIECDEAIAVGRLESDPATPLCIGCASRREQRSPIR